MARLPRARRLPSSPAGSDWRRLLARRCPGVGSGWKAICVKCLSHAGDEGQCPWGGGHWRCVPMARKRLCLISPPPGTHVAVQLSAHRVFFMSFITLFYFCAGSWCQTDINLHLCWYCVHLFGKLDCPWPVTSGHRLALLNLLDASSTVA